MPVYVLVRSTERSFIEQNQPSAESIARAFQSAGEGALSSLGSWVGPRPRISRRPVVGDSFYTEAAQLWRWNGTAAELARNHLLDARNAQLAAALYAKLETETSGTFEARWSSPVVEAHSTALHGSLAWWGEGAAAVTRTENETPTGLGRLGTADNPTGPTTSNTHPLGAEDVARGAARAGDVVGDLALGALALLGGVAAVWAWRASSLALPDPRPSLRRGLARARGALGRRGQ